MSHIPILKPREVMHVLEKHGFELVRQHGSHCQFRHPDGRLTVVPDHPSHDIAPGLLHKIAKEARMNIEDFLGERY